VILKRSTLNTKKCYNKEQNRQWLLLVVPRVLRCILSWLNCSANKLPHPKRFEWYLTTPRRHLPLKAVLSNHFPILHQRNSEREFSIHGGKARVILSWRKPTCCLPHDGNHQTWSQDSIFRLVPGDQAICAAGC
jgi:hypothetical protein